jgi:sigma-B regulation protein RsbU (phosphoserine phosphatase)
MAQEILILTPDHKTRRVSLEGQSLSLGRSHDNDLSYPEDASLSRKHLMLSIDGNRIQVEDLGSKNGTLLNGTRITAPETLSPGDRLIVGHLELTLVEEAASSSVVFVPGSGAEIEPAGTVMTRLADLMSSEATEQQVQPGTPDQRGQAFTSPVVKVLLRAGRELANHRPLAELFPLLLDLSIEAVGAERGVLLILEGGRLVTKAAHGEQFRISETVRDQVLQDKRSLLIKDMQQEEAIREQKSISAQQIQTLICVPLQTEDRVIGLIYVDSRSWVRPFLPDDLNMLTFLGNVAAIRIEQERFAQLERENEQAAVIQRRLLPGGPPAIAGLDVAGHNAPCRTVGGDYYDYIDYKDGRIAVALGDVAGKGMEAALIMSNLHPRVQMLGEEPCDLAEFMSRLDKSLVSQLPLNRFVTFFFCLLDPQKDEMTYCNAGHNPPLIVTPSGELQALQPQGTMLGLLPEIGYTQKQIRFAEGDILAIFSDGVTEAARADDEEFGEDRLAQLLIEHREAPAEETVQTVLKAVSVWTNDAPAEDDVTLVIVRRIPAG